MRESSNDDTRQRLEKAAKELFYQKGIKGTTLEMITGKAFVQPSAVSYYFGDKRGLVEKVVSGMFAKIDREADIIAQGEDKVLRNIVWVYVLWYKLSKDPNLTRAYIEYTNDTRMLNGDSSSERFRGFVAGMKESFSGTSEFYTGRGDPDYYFSLNNYLIMGMLNYALKKGDEDSWFLLARTDIKLKATIAGVDDSAMIRERCVAAEELMRRADLSIIDTRF